MNGVVITTTPPGEPAQVRERRVDVSHVLEHFRAQQQRVPALGTRPRVRKHVERADDVDGAGAVLHDIHPDVAVAGPGDGGPERLLSTADVEYRPVDA